MPARKEKRDSAKYGRYTNNHTKAEAPTINAIPRNRHELIARSESLDISNPPIAFTTPNKTLPISLG